VVIGALLEVGKGTTAVPESAAGPSQDLIDLDNEQTMREEWLPRFWDAYDALEE
jgi:cell division control protein 45